MHIFRSCSPVLRPSRPSGFRKYVKTQQPRRRKEKPRQPATLLLHRSSVRARIPRQRCMALRRAGFRPPRLRVLTSRAPLAPATKILATAHLSSRFSPAARKEAVPVWSWAFVKMGHWNYVHPQRNWLSWKALRVKPDPHPHPPCPADTRARTAKAPRQHCWPCQAERAASPVSARNALHTRRYRLSVTPVACLIFPWYRAHRGLLRLTKCYWRHHSVGRNQSKPIQKFVLPLWRSGFSKSQS